MKKISYVLGLSVLVFLACNSEKSQVPGTYVSHSKGQFSISRDTLIIAESSGNDYTIDRHSAFQKIRNGKVKPVELKSTTFIGEYDEKQHRMITLLEGKVLTFDSASGILRLGKKEYKKID